MKKITLILALVLAAILLLASCAGDGNTPATTPSGTTPSAGTTTPSAGTTPPATTTIPADVETTLSGGGDIVLEETTVDVGAESTQPSIESIVDKVVATEIKPLPEKDYNEKTVNVLLRTQFAYEFTEGAGDAIIDEAVYNMVVDVEDEFNVRFNFIDIPGAWGDRANFVNTVHNSVLAEDGAYDMVFGYQAYMIDNIANNDFMNLLDLPYLQLGAEHWTQAGVDTLTLNKRCFMATGDIFLSMWRGLFCMYFNKDIAADNGITDLYELVENKKWTHDKMAEYTMMVSEDLDQNDVHDDKDMYGLASGSTPLRQFIVAYNTPIVSINGADIQMAWNTERTVSVVEKLVTLFQTDYAYNNFTPKVYKDMFRNGNAMFMLTTLDESVNLRSSDVDFGILPYPMLDEAQGNYYSSTTNSSTMACVPVTVNDAEMSALLIEALCRKGSEYVQPAFYNVALKGKYVDEESGKMIDIIREGLRFDFGWVHSVALDLGGSYQDFVDKGDTDFASYYESRIDKYNENIKTIQSMYFD